MISEEASRRAAPTRFSPSVYRAEVPFDVVVLTVILPERSEGLRQLDLSVRWKAVADWAAAIPEVSIGPSSADRRFEQLADQMRADCERFQRPFITFTSSRGRAEWAPWNSAVTAEVRDLLSNDLKRIAGRLAGAS